MKLYVSSIQHGSTGDGPGIRTTVFLKGCNLRCPWCHNPETIPHEVSVLQYRHKEMVMGEWMDIDDIVKEVLEDFDFYENIGGATISGGEPMLQFRGVAELISRLREKGVACIVDTAGCVPYESFEHLGDTVNTYFFDLKAATDEDYSAIGGHFGRITENLSRLIADGKRVRVRIPLIPGFNADAAYSQKMCDVLRRVGATEVDLLPFHRLGSGKYDALHLTYAYKHVEPMKLSYAEDIAQIYRNYFNVRVEK